MTAIMEQIPHPVRNGRSPYEFSRDLGEAISSLNKAFKHVRNNDERDYLIKMASEKYSISEGYLKKVGLFKVIKFYK